MGRKIPGKKHRGVKDPEKQRAERMKSIQHKINAPPINPDDQAVPKSLQRIIDFKEKFMNGVTPLKHRKKISSNRAPGISNASEHTVAKINSKKIKPKETPDFVQQEGESDRSFLCRVEQTVETVINESKFEEKYGVTVKRNIHSGEIEGVENRPKDEIDVLMKEAKKGKGKKKTDTEPKITKSQKKQRKLLEKKEQKILNRGIDFDHFKDIVEFGDIVHGPPTLTTPRRVNKDEYAPRPGRKDLLLKSFLKPSAKKPKVQFPKTSKKTLIPQTSNSGKIDKKGKRKDLPNAVRMQLESHRNEVVNAYRTIKENKIRHTE